MFANAVLLHLTVEEAQSVLRKTAGILNEGGYFALTLKQGEGTLWTEEKLGAPRFFTLWQPGPIRHELESAGYQIVKLYPDDEPTAKWLHIIAQKTV